MNKELKANNIMLFNSYKELQEYKDRRDEERKRKYLLKIRLEKLEKIRSRIVK
jgi:hypothetical protein